jgi:hypothetical protein
MNTQTNKPLYLPLLSGGVAALLVSGIAIASLAISAQGFDGVFGSPRSAEAAETPTGAAGGMAWCAECGVIESTRKIELPNEMLRVHALDRIAGGNWGEMNGNRSGSYVITVRLQNGTVRTITDTHPAKWRPGERVTVIGALE